MEVLLRRTENYSLNVFENFLKILAISIDQIYYF